MFDANGDTLLSKEEFIKYTESKFDKMDANSDGQLSIDEYKSHHKDRKDKMKKRWQHHEKNQETGSQE